ncbi:FadR/GntR family transcriptional regulator [Ammoniphilus sp. CFH 90114]|uniref:FadR/GntR family transcriptional regulator n=1 Tax=Ammoniphilus sp. CFH 90114 TaxID=2493665 RepID=UPI00100DD598|nr:FadR/GntR family transcriptional regulator [Ammoniphilus sp. CFH 90114]RXT13529.1 FadR family transcriptional regulator [Ammoniphilus sp. CFH 90114]
MNLTKKSYEIIAEELQRIIESGVYKPGDKIDTIENLAKEYHVGRSTIREALSQLKARGLVESRQGGGTYVTNPIPTISPFHDIPTSNTMELTQLLQVRKILEVGCIELAAELRTTSHIEELERILHQMKDAIGNEEISQVYDVNFHLAIAKATQNPLLQSMMEGISTVMIRTIRDTRKLWLYSKKESADRLFEEHHRMLQAIIQRDSNSAVTVMREHLSKVESVLKDS